MKIEERDYQNSSIDAGVEANNGLIIAPTAAGKSVILGGIANNLDSGTLVIQPSQEILESNFEKAISYGIDASIYSASLGKKEVSNFTYGTIKSVVNSLNKFSHIKNILIDEAHLVNSKSGIYKTLIETINPEKLIGVTATPYRLSSTKKWGSSMKLLTRTRPKVFKEIIYNINPRDLLDLGYIIAPKLLELNVDNSFLKFNSSGTNFTDESIEIFTEKNNTVDKAVSLVTQKAYKHNHILVFFNSISSSKLFVKRLKEHNIKVDEINDKSENRTEKLKRFHNGEFKVLSNVKVLTTGYDFPALDCIIDCSPTTSAALHYQKLGRLVRIFAGKEPVYYDLGNNIKRLGNPLNYMYHKNRTGLDEIYSERGRVTTRVLSQEAECELGLTFGRYKNSKVKDLPDDYIDWCLDGGLKYKEWLNVLFSEKIRREYFINT